MSDPYRDGAGYRCPRCQELLAKEGEDGDYVCLACCGRFLPNLEIGKLFRVEWVEARATANLYAIDKFRPAACPMCEKPLAERYAGENPPVALGQCTTHGVWTDDPTRRTFLHAYARSLEQLRKKAAYAARVKTEAAAPRFAHREELIEAIRTGDRAAIDILVTRIEQLEAALKLR